MRELMVSICELLRLRQWYHCLNRRYHVAYWWYAKREIITQNNSTASDAHVRIASKKQSDAIVRTGVSVKQASTY